MRHTYKSWGFSPTSAQRAVRPHWQAETRFEENTKYLPFGRGRSYGDSCLNSLGTLLDSQHQNHILDFDEEVGTITCESGVTFSDIINACVPKKWFLPVSPGTRFVSVGGAIANDVHGKNHHRRGTIGCHVTEMEILRTDGTRLYCSPSVNAPLFNATIGGLGLTGYICWATISLIPVTSEYMAVERLIFHSLEEFYEISASKQDNFEYSVAWLDCSSSRSNFGRGVFFGADHFKSSDGRINDFELVKPNTSIPFNLPSSTLSPAFVKVFNTLYYHKHKLSGEKYKADLGSYFYPLDNTLNWNRMYGAKGFFQYQFVVPTNRKSHLESILRLITESRSASFLAVLKEFGDIESPGLMSFPRPGYCLALDFPNKGITTEGLINALDDIVKDANGAAYPAKDRLMRPDSFKQYFPKLSEFEKMLDPGMSSDYWMRVSS